MATLFSELIEGKRAKDIGVQAFLKKPVLRKELAETVRKLLDGKSRGEEDRRLTETQAGGIGNG